MRLDELTRGDFPILDRIINGHRVMYLDSAASSQKPRQVIEAMSRYYEQSHANVHRSIHALGEEATELSSWPGTACGSSSGREAERKSSSRAGPPTA